MVQANAQALSFHLSSIASQCSKEALGALRPSRFDRTRQTRRFTGVCRAAMIDLRDVGGRGYLRATVRGPNVFACIEVHDHPRCKVVVFGPLARSFSVGPFRSQKTARLRNIPLLILGIAGGEEYPIRASDDAASSGRCRSPLSTPRPASGDDLPPIKKRDGSP
jgi:hypothetical protein